jgi:glyoxylase-like metal-dependent hydrolase (beta-lactamase superfamily II)
MRLLFALLLFLLPAFTARAQYDTVEIRIQKLADRIAMLTGAGGNLGVCFGADGCFLIDDQFAPLTEKIRSALRTLSDQPVRFVLNTHFHGDHTGGNENLGQAGAVIVAHENVRKRMSVDQFNAVFKRTTPPAPKAALPIVTFAADVTFYLNGEEIRVFHVEPAHTDGDAFVQFVHANVIHTGDLCFSGRYPVIDVSAGGSIDGMIAAAGRILTAATPETKIIPGHGPMMNMEDVRQYREMLSAIRDAVKKLIDDGKSLEEVKAATPTARFDERWGKGSAADRFTEIVYNSLKK